jgi:hypothetical protein
MEHLQEQAQLTNLKVLEIDTLDAAGGGDGGGGGTDVGAIVGGCIAALVVAAGALAAFLFLRRRRRLKAKHFATKSAMHTRDMVRVYLQLCIDAGNSHSHPGPLSCGEYSNV